MRALFLHSSVFEREPERVLDDLAALTNIDTLLVYLWANSPHGDRLLLPSADGFGDRCPPVSVVGEAEFDAFSGLLDMARAKGFQVGCHLSPLFAYTEKLAGLRNEALVQPSFYDLPFDNLIWACPNNPATVAYAVGVARNAVAAWPQADLLELNHVEYPLWPHKGFGSLFTCFCQHCQDAAQAAGIDFAALKRAAALLLEDLTTAPSVSDSALSSPANLVLNTMLRRPQIAQWLAFRMTSLSQFVRTVTEAAREAAAQFNPALKIGMDFFLPSAANLLGTDFAALYPLFDWVAPKFPDYLTGSIVPMIADEMNATGSPARTTALREDIRRILDVGAGPANYEPCPSLAEELLYSNTFDATIIDRQMSYLSPLNGKVRSYPWVWLYNRDLSGLRDKFEALGRNGFEGYCLWLWEPDMTTAALKKTQGIF
jgi:hypothetical protein